MVKVIIQQLNNARKRDSILIVIKVSFDTIVILKLHNL